MDRRHAIITFSVGGLGLMTGCIARAPSREVVRIVGYNDMEELLEGLVQLAGDLGLPYRYELDLPATKAAPAALLEGRSTLAPMGAEMDCERQEAIRLAWGGYPIGFRVAHASLSADALSSPTGILVNRANPLPSITVAQVREIFAGPGDIPASPCWGQLGLTGDWDTRPIVISGLDETTAIGKFMLGQLCADRFAEKMSRHFQSRDVAASVAADEAAIGIGNLNHASGNVRAVTIVDHAGIARIPSKDTIASGRYPFDRFLMIYARTDRNGRIDPVAARFMELALSRAGQESIGRGSLGYIPLNADKLGKERAKLGAASAGYLQQIVLTGSAPTILKPLASRWKEQFASNVDPIDLEFERTFGPPLGNRDEGFAEFLRRKRDFAFLTREIDADDLETFRRHHGDDPMIVPIALGAWDRFGLVDAVTIIVNERNPLTSLDFCQLESIFFRSTGKVCRASNWADLGVAKFGDVAVRVVGNKEWHPHESAKALTIRRLIIDAAHGAGQWRPVSGVVDSHHVAEQVASDPFSIGFTAVGHLREGVRMVPIVPPDGQEAVLPTEETVTAGRYPFARTIDLIMARDASGVPALPLRKLAEALLSPEGQAAILDEGTFRPLGRDRLEASLALIGKAARLVTCRPHDAKCPR